jgi:ABC-type Zn2+ transport system substrate-binding protein/surface adhesin
VVPAKTDMTRGRRNLKVFLQGTVSRDFYEYISIMSDFIRWVGDDFEAFLENNADLLDREFSDLT